MELPPIAHNNCGNIQTVRNSKKKYGQVHTVINLQELKNTLTYLQSELYRIETMAGTLSAVERDHFQKLSSYDHSELADIAVEEQSASRQLGTMRQMCLAMAQRVEGLKKEIEHDGEEESAELAETH